LKTIKNKLQLDLLNEMFIKIPEGTVEMHDDRIKKVWQVKIASFNLAKFPVTQDLYELVTKNNPSNIKGAKLPVETVTWIDAIQFCNYLSEALGKVPYCLIDPISEKISIKDEANGFRLPAEAEWQYACQAGDKITKYGDLDQIAYFKNNSANQTHVVGQKQPNQWGIYDMLGNVWKWCSDIYDEEIYGNYWVFRGGGWCDTERSVMATTRRRSHPVSFKIDDLGFRIALNLND